jgi:TPR repeat protein
MRWRFGTKQENLVSRHCHEPEIVVDNIQVAAPFVAPAVRVTPLLTAAAVAIQLSANSALAGALEDCAAAYDRKDYAAALQPCLSLAEHGDARAQFSLGGMYYNGQGVRQDYPEAAKWTRKAAELGYTPAQAHLGVLYWNGQGVQQDVVLAYMWLSLAATNEPDAVRDRDLAASQMTPDEIAEAQRLARDWKPMTPSQ